MCESPVGPWEKMWHPNILECTQEIVHTKEMFGFIQPSTGHINGLHGPQMAYKQPLENLGLCAFSLKGFITPFGKRITIRKKTPFNNFSFPNHPSAHLKTDTVKVNLKEGHLQQL